MKWININKENLGAPLYVTPNYDDGSKRSCIDYCSGIPELDKVLAEKRKPLFATNIELGVLVCEDILMFILVRGSKGVGHFSISRDNVVKVNATHEQMLNIRKDPGPDVGSVLSRVFGIFGAIVSTFGDIIKSNKKSKPVLGSIFEIIFDSTKDGQNEKVVLACTSKNKERIERVFHNIVKSNQLKDI